MKIGFYGNANNYPFALARAIMRLGHEVTFLVASKEALNRPENRYADIATPYPPWIVDVSHSIRWHCLAPFSGRARVIEALNQCDAAILNEEGPALGEELRVPYAALLTGSDLSVFANPKQIGSLKKQVIGNPAWLRRLVSVVIPNQAIQRLLTDPQRRGIRNARIVSFFPTGLVPASDRLLDDIGVTSAQRREVLFTDLTIAPYTPPPNSARFRVFSATRLTWIPDPGRGLTPLDLKGSDIMVRGIAEYYRRTRKKLDVHLVRKGQHIAETEALIESLGIGDQVTWHREMNQREIVSMFQQADLVIEQLAQSALGMAGLDALATGRPVIANGRPEILGRIAPGPSPILQASTLEEVASHLEKMVDSRPVREQASIESHAWIAKYFSGDVAAQVFIDGLRSIT